MNFPSSFGWLFHTPTPSERKAEANQEALQKVEIFAKKYNEGSETFQNSLKQTHEDNMKETHKKHEEFINTLKSKEKV